MTDVVDASKSADLLSQVQEYKKDDKNVLPRKKQKREEAAPEERHPINECPNMILKILDSMNATQVQDDERYP